MKEQALFLFEFLRDPQVASVMPTTNLTVENICENIDYSNRSIIVEFGPGTGRVTRGLQKKLGEQSELILIETNKRFYDTLRKKFRKDKRISVYNKSAVMLKDILSWEEIDRVDYIVSGIPFSLLDENKIEIILNASKIALEPHGKFIAYQFKDSIREHLKKYFARIETEDLKRSILKTYIAQN